MDSENGEEDNEIIRSSESENIKSEEEDDDVSFFFKSMPIPKLNKCKSL